MTRDQIISRLRAAADALDRAGRVEGRVRFVCEGCEEVELFDAPDEARKAAEQWVEPDGDEFHEAAERVTWGVYVQLEAAEPKILDAEDAASLGFSPEAAVYSQIDFVDMWGEGTDSVIEEIEQIDRRLCAIIHRVTSPGATARASIAIRALRRLESAIKEPTP